MYTYWPTRSLHDALPTYPTRFLERFTERLLAAADRVLSPRACLAATAALEHYTATLAEQLLRDEDTRALFGHDKVRELFLWRSEEHTSELQSLMRISYAVFCLQKKIK